MAKVERFKYRLTQEDNDKIRSLTEDIVNITSVLKPHDVTTATLYSDIMARVVISNVLKSASDIRPLVIEVGVSLIYVAPVTEGDKTSLVWSIDN